MKVNQLWNTRLKSLLYFKTSPVISKFKNQFHKQLTFSEHKLTLRKQQAKQGQVVRQSSKLDLMIACKVEACMAGKAVSLSYRYRL